MTQNYIVRPRQHWLDGIATSNGKVSQFVVDSVGSGYSVEAQVTGIDSIAGLQFEIIPQKHFGGSDAYELKSPEEMKSATKVKEMSIAPGGLIHQVIVDDTFSARNRDTEYSTMFNVQLIDVASCGALGIPVPSTPVTAQTYAEHGYPFFKMYEEPSQVFGTFNVQSIGALDDAKGVNAAMHEGEKDLQFPTKVILNTVDPMSTFSSAA